MIQQTCTRRLTFEAGHRVYGHESKCAHFHGHSYKVFVEAQVDSLDFIGRVVDFSVLKDRIGGWIDTHWDHAFLFSKKDIECSTLFGSDERFMGQKHFVCPFSPTAEMMAQYLLYTICPKVMEGTHVKIVKVVVWETENCYATAQVPR